MAASPTGETHFLGETGHDSRPLIECYRPRAKRGALLTAPRSFSRNAVTHRSHVLRSLGYPIGPLEQEEGESHALYDHSLVADRTSHSRLRQHGARAATAPASNTTVGFGTAARRRVGRCHPVRAG